MTDEQTPRRPARPTIADVARRAGVSGAAVSFAVNGRPGVGDETRERILRAAGELGWRPSARARALTQDRAWAVGLVLSRRPDRLEVDDFFARFLGGVERVLTPNDYALLLRLLPIEGSANLDAYERLAASGRVDGFLLTDVLLDDPRFEFLEATELPAVVAGRPRGPCPFPAVETQHARGVSALVEHLLALGHRELAFVGGHASYEYVRTRLDVWRETLTAAGLALGPVAFAGPSDPAAAQATAGVLDARPRPTAVFYTSDLLALAGMGVARERGLDVPADLTIAGFDDSQVAALASPPLTTVHVDYGEFGEHAAQALLAQVEGRPLPEFRPSEPALVMRGSSAPPRRR